ncbi:unnamed protein product [Anisakis simplex]|uniref:Paxillin-related (inferred by orthology to a S. mansoni protein) n=1 Tax=Anisakis simplex TaxID=6269 RepID=A0A0M3JRN9_ANISI|nr:unnamed protein product [Anisakis simplex]
MDKSTAAVNGPVQLAINDEDENNYCLTLRRLAATNEFSKKSGAKWIIRCHACHEPLSRMMAFKGRLVYTLGNVWHREHLRCVRCHCRVGPGGRDLRALTSNQSLPLCIDCHMEENHPKCAGKNDVQKHSKRHAFERSANSGIVVVSYAPDATPHFLSKSSQKLGMNSDLKFYIFNDKPYDTNCYYLTKYNSLLTSTAQVVFLGIFLTITTILATFDQIFTNLPSGSGLEPAANTTTTTVPPNQKASAAVNQDTDSNNSSSSSPRTATSGTSIANTTIESSTSTVPITK